MPAPRQPMRPPPRRPQQAPSPEPEVQSRPGPSLQLLENGLKWSSTEMGPALELQADLFYRVALMLSTAIAERDTVKLHLAQAEARAASNFRDAVDDKGKKPTVSEIEQQVILDPQVMRLSQTLNEVIARTAQLTALKDAYVQRGYAIKDHILLQQISGALYSGAAEQNRREAAEATNEYMRQRPARTQTT